MLWLEGSTPWKRMRAGLVGDKAPLRKAATRKKAPAKKSARKAKESAEAGATA